MLEFHAICLRPDQEVVNLARDGPARWINASEPTLNGPDRVHASGHGVDPELRNPVLLLWPAKHREFSIKSYEVLPSHVYLRRSTTNYEEPGQK